MRSHNEDQVAIEEAVQWLLDEVEACDAALLVRVCVCVCARACVCVSVCVCVRARTYLCGYTYKQSTLSKHIVSTYLGQIAGLKK